MQKIVDTDRRSFLKCSSGVAAGLVGWGAGLQNSAAQGPKAPLPDGAVAEYMWGFVVKSTPELNDPGEVARIAKKALWRSKKDYPIESAVLAFPKGDYRGKAYYEAIGSDLTKDPKKTVGVGEVEFGGSVKIELLYESSKGVWKVIDSGICKMKPRKWTLKDRNKEVPRILAPEAAHCVTERQSKPLRYGKAKASLALGVSEFEGHFVVANSKAQLSIGKKDPIYRSVGFGAGNCWGSYKFLWSVVLRRTTIYKNPEGKELKRVRKDFTVAQMKKDLKLIIMAGQL